MGTNIVIKKSKKQHQYQTTYLSLIYNLKSYPKVALMG